MGSLKHWNYFLGLEFKKVPEYPGYLFLLVKYLYKDQIIFHEESQNFTKIFWTSLLLNKYFAKELGEIYESKYLQM